jgi:hypothetical protein
MLTVGLLILAGSLAQAPDDLTQDPTALVGTIVEIVYPQDVPLPQGWPESGRRSGRLERVTPRPRNFGGYTLLVTWDEPWGPPVQETLSDTVRDASGRTQTLVILSESDRDRELRIKREWTERGFVNVGNAPLDPAAWLPKEEVELAEKAQQMARETAARLHPAPEAADAPEQAPTPEERPAPGPLTRRGPQIAIALAAIVLAAVILKTMVF